MNDMCNLSVGGKKHFAPNFCIDNCNSCVYIGYIQYLRVKEKQMNIIISNSSGVPLYEQIEEQIKSQIMTGELVQGEALPSMRVLAKELKISIITTKRAYEDLERDGFIESVTGKGSFVKGINNELVKESMMFAIEELLEAAVDKACMAKIPLAQLEEMLRLLYEEREENGRDKECD